MEEKIKEVLYRLLAIKKMAKELHYDFAKDYALHLLYDRIADGLDGLSDRLTEIGLLGKGASAPSAVERLSRAEKMVLKADRDSLKDLCVELAYFVEGIKADRGTNAVLDAIAEKMRESVALL